MGKIKQGILGAISGKVGSVVGASWKGIATLRSRPASVANPRTAGQIAARTRFSALVAFASQILGTIIKPMWDRFAQQQSGYNAFISTNYVAVDAEGNFDPTLIKTSKGKMDSTGIVSAIADISGNSIQATWTNDSGQGFKLATDRAYITVYNPVTNQVIGSSSLRDTRSSSTASVTVQSIQLTDIWEVYLAFRRVDGTIVSDSSYLQAIIQP